MNKLAINISAVAFLAVAAFPTTAQEAKATAQECKSAFYRSSAAGSCFEKTISATGNYCRIVARCLKPGGSDTEGVIDDTITRVPNYHNCNGLPRYGGCGKDAPEVPASEKIKAERATAAEKEMVGRK